MLRAPVPTAFALAFFWTGANSTDDIFEACGTPAKKKGIGKGTVKTLSWALNAIGCGSLGNGQTVGLRGLFDQLGATTHSPVYQNVIELQILSAG